MTAWRLLRDGISEPFRHFAVEEALTRGIDEGFTPPTLRLRQVEPSVWIGVYQYPDEDVDVPYCTGKRIKIVRRPNPGGAVYQDEGSFCYSLFCPKKVLFPLLGVDRPEQLYPVLGQAIIGTCRDFGVEAALSPVNDITIGGRKVYGSAQVEFYSAFVHSGTFLVKTDIDEMDRCLNPSRLKFSDKGFSNVKERVINLCQAAGRDIAVTAVMDRLLFHLEKVLGAPFQPSALSPREVSETERLYRDKYADPAWTSREKTGYDTVVSAKSASGVITLGLSLDGETISDIHIKGDFLVADQQELARIIGSLKGKPRSTALEKIEVSNLPVDLKTTLTGLFAQLEPKGDL